MNKNYIHIIPFLWFGLLSTMGTYASTEKNLELPKEHIDISKDTLVISNKKKQAFNQAEAENFEIIGLVVDDVITKLGKPILRDEGREHG